MAAPPRADRDDLELDWELAKTQKGLAERPQADPSCEKRFFQSERDRLTVLSDRLLAI